MSPALLMSHRQLVSHLALGSMFLDSGSTEYTGPTSLAASSVGAGRPTLLSPVSVLQACPALKFLQLYHLRLYSLAVSSAWNALPPSDLYLLLNPFLLVFTDWPEHHFSRRALLIPPGLTSSVLPCIILTLPCQSPSRSPSNQGSSLSGSLLRTQKMLTNEWTLYPRPAGGSLTTRILFVVEFKKDSEIFSWGFYINSTVLLQVKNTTG